MKVCINFFLFAFTFEYGRWIAGIFFEASAKCRWSVETGLIGYGCDRYIICQHFLSTTDSLFTKIVIKGCIGILFKQPGKMKFGKIYHNALFEHPGVVTFSDHYPVWNSLWHKEISFLKTAKIYRFPRKYHFWNILQSFWQNYYKWVHSFWRYLV